MATGPLSGSDGKVDLYGRTVAQPEKLVEPDAAPATQEAALAADTPWQPASRPATRKKIESATTFEFSNDNLNKGLVRVLVPAKDRDVRYPEYADDDGQTFGAAIQQTFTDSESGRQLTVIAEYNMLTEQGATSNPRLHNRRVDVLDVVAQLNRKTPIAPGTVLITGIGGGVQVLGDLGGLELQSWFHEKGGMGGRSVRGGLQNQYTVPNLRVAPVVTLGAGIEWNGSAGPVDFKAQASVQANLSPGTALSSVRGKVGGEVSLRGIATLEANMTAGAAIARGEALGFIRPNKLDIGYEARLRLDVLEKKGFPLKPFVAVQRGGPMGDTTYSLGFTVGTGSLPWLNPRR